MTNVKPHFRSPGEMGTKALAISLSSERKNHTMYVFPVSTVVATQPPPLTLNCVLQSRHFLSVVVYLPSLALFD